MGLCMVGRCPNGKVFMKIVICNAFSLGMLEGSTSLHFSKTTVGDARALVSRADSVRSVVGHADTAAVMSAELGFPVGFNRETYKMGGRDWLIVGQYTGPRLPEGATALPPGATIQWWLVSQEAGATFQ